MNLFQYGQFFSRHPDPAVKKHGEFLLGVIDQLQASLSITQDWANRVSIPGLSRFQQMKLEILLYALERNGGHKAKAAAWLGVARDTLYVANKILKRKIANNVIPLTNENHEQNNLAPAPDSAERVPSAKIVSR